MRLILTETVKALGEIGEFVNVSPGYARNFLIPNQLAVVADEGNSNTIKNQQKRLAMKIEEAKNAALDIKKKIDGLVIELVKKVGSNGRLFGTVTNTELAKELLQRDVDVERRLITIENPIKHLGEHEVTVKLFTEVIAEFKVKVVIDPKQAEELKKKQIAAEKRAIARKAKAAAEGEEVAEGSEEATGEETEATSESTEEVVEA